MWTRPLLYERLTWPEVRRAVEEGRVAVIPVATLEDHGPHLPIDADLRITAEICRRVADDLPDDTVLLPAIPHGYSPHHMDFPGPITIAWETFTRYCVDVGTSLARHGFTRMMYVNGHGSNQNLVEMAARLVGLEHPNVLAAACFYLASPEGLAVVEEVRETERGGMGHACELETSIYLAIEPEAVDMSKAVDETPPDQTEHAWFDWTDGSLKLHAVVVVVQPHRRTRPPDAGDGREGQDAAGRRRRRDRGVRPRAEGAPAARTAGTERAGVTGGTR